MTVTGTATAPERWWLREENNAAAAREAESPAAFAGVVIFTIILLLSPQTWFPILGKLRIAFVTAGAAGAFLLWDRWKAGQPLLNVSREMLVAFALPAWAFLTLPLSYWPGGSASLLTEMYLKALAIFWLLANLVSTPSRLRVTAMTLIVCSVPLAVTGVKNFLTGNFAGGDNSVLRIAGYQNALAQNPNDLALMLNLILPLAIAVFLGSAKPMIRIAALGIIGVSAISVVLTFSRGGFLGLATIGLIYVARLVRRPGSDRSWAFAAILAVFIAIPFLPASYIDRITTITNIESDSTGSSQERWATTLAAVRAVRENPIAGAGIGMDMLALNDMGGPKWKPIHNVYLQYAVDLGLPGVGLFLLLFYGAFRAVRRARRSFALRPHNREQFLLAEAVEVSLLVFAAEAFFHPVAYNFYFYYMGALALAVREVERGLYA